MTREEEEKGVNVSVAVDRRVEEENAQVTWDGMVMGHGRNP